MGLSRWIAACSARSSVVGRSVRSPMDRVQPVTGLVVDEPLAVDLKVAAYAGLCYQEVESEDHHSAVFVFAERPGAKFLTLTKPSMTFSSFVSMGMA
jgi:hypothetical protein